MAVSLIMVGHQNDYFAKDSILRGVAEEPGQRLTLMSLSSVISAM
jgi:hypothetical protein